MYLGKRSLPAALFSVEPILIVNSGSRNKHVQYGSLFLAVPGTYAVAPVVAAWMSNNSEPYYRRATSIAFGFIATNSVSCLPPVDDACD